MTSVVALAVMGVVVAPSAAFADADDGAVTVRVVQEVNANGVVDDTIMEPPLMDVTVHLTDADGNTIATTTDVDGLAVFDTTDLVGGQYRVDVDNPRPGTFFPGHAANGQTPEASLPIDLTDPDNEKLSSATEFVDVRDGQDAYVNTSFWYPPYYCQENPAVCGALQPWDAPAGEQNPPDKQTLFSTSYDLAEEAAKLSTHEEIGAVYGIAYDRANERIFSAAYAKRGSAYGPGGTGAIYVTDLDSTTYPLTGTTNQWTTVPNAGDDSHDMDTNQDFGFFNDVGNQSLGDIDITDDNDYLFGVNMFDNTVFVYDLADDSYIDSYPIPNPGCGDDWHAMGTGVGIDTEYVGGVCSGEDSQDMSGVSAHVFAFDAATGDFNGGVLNQPLTYEKGIPYNYSVNCSGAMSTDPTVGRWFPWIDHYPEGPNLQNPDGCGTSWMSYPTPALSDIVEETNGDLVITFRDRFTDQMGHFATVQHPDGTFGFAGQPASGGDIVRGCALIDGSFVLDPNYAGEMLAPGSVCTNNNVPGANDGGSQARTFREFYIGDTRFGSHQESFYGGMALSHAAPTLLSSGFDPTNIANTQGVSAIQRDGLPATGTVGLLVDDYTSSGRFGKGAGMADLEVLCDEAPIQIGNRVWADSDRDGVQDPGEPPIAGVTVNLYDADGELVGTTVTDENGNYFFDDSNVDGGLGQNADYTVAVDNPDDYAPGGPLDGHEPTVAHAGDDAEHDSDGVVPDGGQYPEAAVTTGDAGVDDHSFDFGFIQHKPAVDIEKYDAVGGPSEGDADTTADAVAYSPGEARTITFELTNTGTDPLHEVVVTDDTIAGGAVTDMACLFPGNDDPTSGVLSGDSWTVPWSESHNGTPPETWNPGVTFECTATLTMGADAVPHANRATVTATSVDSGETVTDEDAYHAFTGAVQLVKYDGRDGFTPTQDDAGVPEKPLIDGSERDANTADTAITYVVPAGSDTSGPFPVSWAVTNTGSTYLGAVSIADDTLNGPDLTDVTCDFSPLDGPPTGTSWDGPWAPGDTFYCTGNLTLDSTGDHSTHGDTAQVNATVIQPASNPDYDGTPGSSPYLDEPQLDEDGTPVLSGQDVADDDDYHAEVAVPGVSIDKGDGDAADAAITHDADSMDDGQAYVPGETRDIVFTVTNNGHTPLYDVVVTDTLLTGDTAVDDMSCTFPGESSPTAGTLDGTTWTVAWAASFDVADGAAWQPGDTFDCAATLTMAGPDAPHVDLATVTTTLSPQGTADSPPEEPDGPAAENPYHAYTGDIQVIKYDGNAADPEVGSGPASWTVPAKPLTDAGQDANDTAHAVNHPAGQAQPVRWVVTNTGATWLTNIGITDTTSDGPDIGSWTCDLTGVGGPDSYSFTSSGPWPGPLAPGASFFCEGQLTLAAVQTHTDVVDVTGTVVQPLHDDNGQPILNDDGAPEYATDGDGQPIASDLTVTDDDPFHATTQSAPPTSSEDSHAAAPTETIPPTPTTTVTDSSLSYTGLPLAGMIGLVLVLLGGGAMLFLVGRRRRSSSH